MRKLTKFMPIVALALAMGCSDSSNNTSDQTSVMPLNQWLNEAYDARLQLSPLTLASLGRKELYDQFDDNSDAAKSQALDMYRFQIEAMHAIYDYDTLTIDEQLRFDYYEYLFNEATTLGQFDDHVFYFNQMSGVHTGYPMTVITYHQFDTAADAYAYPARLSGMVNALRNDLERAKAAAEIGVRPPQFAYEIVIAESTALVSGLPFGESDAKSPLYAHGTAGIDALVESNELTPAQRDTIDAELVKVLTEEVKPVYDDIIAFVEADLANAAPTETSSGIASTPRGAEYYAALLKQYTTTDLTAEQVHQIGLDEVARITAQMEEIKERVNFDGSLQEFFNFIQTDDRFFFPNTDEGRQAYLDESTRHINNIMERAPEFFSRIPKSPIEVRRVEPYREQPGAPQHYSPGFADGSKPGIYYAHLIDMRAMPKSELEAIAYHEGVPGHHFDWAMTAENPDVPLFQSNTYISFHGEGWALYSELLAQEMGGYQDPYSEFGRLMTEIWRAVRLVVDTGLHHYGWTEQEAIKYMLDHNPIAPAAAVAEIHRYQVLPGQATSYKMGMLKIMELRALAESELGDAFDIRGFHDAILAQGALPSTLLERRVQAWIDSVKAQ